MEEVFGGRRRSSIIDIGKEAEKADFELVHKENENEIYMKVEKFIADPKNHEPIVRPKTAPLPPVWKVVLCSIRSYYANCFYFIVQLGYFLYIFQLIIARERNISPEEVPEIPIVYQDVDPELSRPTRFPKEGEEPHYRLGPGHFRPVHKGFYKHVIWNPEAAREKYCNGPPPEPDFIYADRELPPLVLQEEKASSRMSSGSEISRQ